MEKDNDTGSQSSVGIKRLRIPVISLLVFISGFSGLVYQVLWMKQLGLLFGNTAYATSTTLAAFFAGLGAGSWWWGRISAKSSNPMRLYAFLELGIALTALVYFLILKIFYGIYPSIYELEAGAGGMLLIKFALSLLLIFPPAFFMGGTVPAIGQAIIRSRESFGKLASFIYGINTLGAAIGVATAAFFLVPNLGYKTTYIISVGLSVSVGLWAWLMRGETSVGDSESESSMAESVSSSQLDRFVIMALCFFSGFAVLALEVVWTRIFAQVHENSVYSFAIILTVVLVCLALGAWISSLLSRFKAPPFITVMVLMMVGGLLLLLGPSMLMGATNDLSPIDKIETWGEYVGGIFGMGFAGIGLVVLTLGTVFPYLMKVVERDAILPGRTLGQLLAINTAGAIVGALVCGFVLLPWLGMWGSMRLLTATYIIVGMLVHVSLNGMGVVSRIMGVACLLLLFTVLNPVHLATHGDKSGKSRGKILKVWEGSDCTVTVIERKDGHRLIQVNGSYSLGSTAAYSEQANQSRIPLYIYPDTESICYIGLGTGMSAGAALDTKRFPNVKSIVSCELTPEVVEAAKDFIPHEFTGGLFKDPRSTILIEDGRHFLMATDQTFDMINSDLFLPYRRGAGSLYSLEHYQAASSRLNPDGVFVQWLPLYQLTEYEFRTIVSTMMKVFPQVTMWRNNFVPGGEKVALIAQLNDKPFPKLPEANRAELRDAVQGMHWNSAAPEMARPEPEAITFFYAGNITAAGGMFADAPVNTDDMPVIEYQTPHTFRKIAEEDKVIWFVGPKLTGVIHDILKECPVTNDPMLSQHTKLSRHMVIAGAAFHEAMIAKQLGQPQKADIEWEVFQRQWRMSAE